MRERVVVSLLAVVVVAGALLAVRDAHAEGGVLRPAFRPDPSTASDPEQAQVADYRHPRAGVALPDGFVPRRLAPGEQPPQFVVVSFDGVGWQEQWDHWLAVGREVPFRFTGFLSGTYLLSERTRRHYAPPGYPRGTAEIAWQDDAALRTELGDLDRAIAAGHEIGTHFNGHFCVGSGLPTGGDTWSTAEWGAELDQFFALLQNVRRNNGLPADLPLSLDARDVLGERTPCLEGSPEQLFPALRDRGMTYDASFVRDGIAWPTEDDGIWQLGMPYVPMAGTGHRVIAMDYNFWYLQRTARTAPSAAGSRRDRRQVLATYRAMYDAAYDGNRAPLLLGNHFNDWNRGAYSGALTDFVREVCGDPDTECVPARDLVAWLEVQTPATLSRLQALPAELG